jgi:hypothetical protein
MVEGCVGVMLLLRREHVDFAELRGFGSVSCGVPSYYACLGEDGEAGLAAGGGDKGTGGQVAKV